MASAASSVFSVTALPSASRASRTIAPSSARRLNWWLSLAIVMIVMTMSSSRMPRKTPRMTQPTVRLT